MSERQREKQLREYRVRLLNVVKASYGGWLCCTLEADKVAEEPQGRLAMHGRV
jgi:hypothetical protein